MAEFIYYPKKFLKRVNLSTVVDWYGKTDKKTDTLSTIPHSAPQPHKRLHVEKCPHILPATKEAEEVLKEKPCYYC